MMAWLEEVSAGGAGQPAVVAIVRTLGQCVAIDGRDVLQAIPVPPDMTGVPRRAGDLVGVVTHGQRLVPVVHLRHWFEAKAAHQEESSVAVDGNGCAPASESAPVSGPAVSDTSDARIVVLVSEDRVVGLWGDAVVGLRRCGPGAVQRLFHDERADELFASAVLLDVREPPLPLLEPRRLAALTGIWCAAASGGRGDKALPASTSRMAAMPSASSQLGVFRVGDALVGIRSDRIGELLTTPSLSTPPFPQPGLRGLCEWRGQLLPVVDLTAPLHAVADANAAAWVCVVQHEDLAIGVLVHEIFGLRAVGDIATHAQDIGDRLLVCGETPIERGILQVLDPQALMAHCSQSILSQRGPVHAERAARDGCDKPYMVFEAAGLFASEVGCVQEVIPLPAPIRSRLAAGLPATLSWRGHAVPVRDVLATTREPGVGQTMRQLIVLANGDRRIAVPIKAVKAMIPPHTATLLKVSVGGQHVTIVSAAGSEHSASYTLVDLSAQVLTAQRLPLAA